MSSPSTPSFIKGIYEGLAKQIASQVAAVDSLPNPGDFPIFWVVNDSQTAAIMQAVVNAEQAADRITVITIDAWNALKGRS
ncbi:hypothetical protein [Tsukamurella strandjordii]|uniref:Uncharacterized protein n=1 Tax=Tsukamurella strandjordii TaxID=147577 RepID=A0AA90SSV4_9ACTN|nr:hypothetical protein [Tsukamurella strandjordii]MDP0400236.1 hypothetical protein [Tsukamurella strandjordii]